MEHNYSEADTSTGLMQAAGGSWCSSAIQKPQPLLLSEAGLWKYDFNLRLWVCPHKIFCMHEGGEQCWICFAYCLCVVLSKAEWSKLHEHNGLQELITWCLPSKLGMLLLLLLQYLELTQTFTTFREEQSCSIWLYLTALATLSWQTK